MKPLRNKHLQRNELWRVFRGLGATTRRAVVAAFFVVALTVAACGSLTVFVVAALIAALIVAAMHSRVPEDFMPTPEQLARIDASRARDDLDEYVASGDGDAAYEHLLGELLPLVGRSISVLAGTGEGGAWEPTLMVAGTLHAGRPADEPTDHEVLTFAVGRTGEFRIDRERFARGEAHVVDVGRGLQIVHADGSPLWIFEHDIEPDL